MENEEKNELSALQEFMDRSPEAFNIGLGFIKSLEDNKRRDAQAGAEVAKTQFGHILGRDIGNVNKLRGKSSLDRVIQGALVGASQRNRSDFQKELLKAISAKDKVPFKEAGSEEPIGSSEFRDIQQLGTKINDGDISISTDQISKPQEPFADFLQSAQSQTLDGNQRQSIAPTDRNRSLTQEEQIRALRSSSFGGGRGF